MKVVVPGVDDRVVVHRVVDDELVRGVVLGCTEIELLLRPQDVSLSAYATTALHASAAVAAALVD